MSTKKSLEKLKNILNSASSLAVQWLGLRAFTAVSQFQSLVGELRSHKLQRVVKKSWGGELNKMKTQFIRNVEEVVKAVLRQNV